MSDYDERAPVQIAGEEAALLSPGVCNVLLTIAPGQLLSPGQQVGLIERLGQRRRLVVASEHPFVVSRRDVEPGWQPVGYRDKLADLAVAGTETGAAIIADDEAAEHGLPEGAVPLRAPVDGQFYRRPKPGQPPFIEVGQTIDFGATVGLIEVMKFFYDISFDLPGFEGARAEVVHIAADDAQPVTAGAPLFYVTKK